MNTTALLTVVIVGCVVSSVVGKCCPAAKTVSGDDLRFDFSDAANSSSLPNKLGNNVFLAKFSMPGFSLIYELPKNELFFPTHIELRVDGACNFTIGGYLENDTLWRGSLPSKTFQYPPSSYSGLPDELKGVAMNGLWFECFSYHQTKDPCIMAVMGVRGCRVLASWREARHSYATQFRGTVGQRITKKTTMNNVMSIAEWSTCVKSVLDIDPNPSYLDVCPATAGVQGDTRT